MLRCVVVQASTLELRDGPSWGFDKMPLGPVNPGETVPWKDSFCTLCIWLLSAQVELVLDLSFTAGHQGDTLTSAWAVMDGQESSIGPPMVLEVVRLDSFGKFVCFIMVDLI